MKVGKEDIFVGFTLGIVTSVLANWIWYKLRENNKENKLQYSDKKIIEEMTSQIEDLKKHINDNLA